MSRKTQTLLLGKNVDEFATSVADSVRRGESADLAEAIEDAALRIYTQVVGREARSIVAAIEARAAQLLAIPRVHGPAIPRYGGR